MPIPDFQTLMRPLIEAHSDGMEHLNRDLVRQLADQFGLSDDERRMMLPSGRAKLFDNRVGWAKSHVMQAGCWLRHEGPSPRLPSVGIRR